MWENQIHLSEFGLAQPCCCPWWTAIKLNSHYPTASTGNFPWSSFLIMIFLWGKLIFGILTESFRKTPENLELFLRRRQMFFLTNTGILIYLWAVVLTQCLRDSRVLHGRHGIVGSLFGGGVGFCECTPTTHASFSFGVAKCDIPGNKCPPTPLPSWLLNLSLTDQPAPVLLARSSSFPHLHPPCGLPSPTPSEACIIHLSLGYYGKGHPE